MRLPRNAVVSLAAAVTLMLGLAAARAEEESGRALLRTVEGVVGAVETVAGDGGEAITRVRLLVDGPEPHRLDVLLAPESALRETGFEVAPGDRLRARIFLSGGDTVEAHKVLNLSRGMMLRLRTLRRVPLWDSDGRWQGGPGRDHRGPGDGGHRHRGTGAGR